MAASGERDGSESVAGGSGPGAAQRRHVSGLWMGSAVPSADFEHEVATNPIQWSLSLLEANTASPSAFGAGFFDDAGDVPGSPVLIFTLVGAWDPRSNRVEITKRYQGLSDDLKILYKGRLSDGPDGQPVLSGTWRNALEGTHGTFACRLEE